jgi:tetratricopeptide (TPR) repeat protein
VPKFPILALALILSAACATPGPPTQPNDREWNLIAADYQWLDSLRNAQPKLPPSAPRKQQIEQMLANLAKIEPVYNSFQEKVREYYDRTHDPRAAQVLAREKIILGDEYLVISRYERALDLYRSAAQIDPANNDAKSRINLAEGRRYVSMSSFSTVKNGMKEDDVRNLIGLPREDWIKQVVQNGRVYAVWIYPKADGGASAVYFDNGVVYHTNWNAAAPQPQAAQTR